MKHFKKISLFIALTMCLVINLAARAHPTPIFDSLSPNLQEIMRLYGKNFLYGYSNGKTPEEVAEQHLSGYNVYFDGSLYEGHEGPMKLTNEDIESLYNLPCVKQLDLERFDLKDVDINKFLGINNNKTMEFLDLRHCYFDTYDKKQIAARITNKEYTVDIDTNIWILWPGVDIYDIIDDGRLKNCH